MQLASLGAKIALVSRTESDLKKVKKEILKKGGNAEYFVCDVTDRNLISSTVEAIKSVEVSKI